jgi:hypothetical protein
MTRVPVKRRNRPILRPMGIVAVQCAAVAADLQEFG